MSSTDYRGALIFVTCALLQLVHNGRAVIVNTHNGMIEGKTSYTVEQNKTYYAFTRIPYAMPPLGILRFQAPQPIDTWHGILPTVTDPIGCVQPNQDQIIGQEDCLYLNVYTTQLPDITKPLLPVMVWIYGGGFEAGSSDYNQYGPDYFLDQDVVFVTLNYRLGIFGFMSLKDFVVPGNNGFKDQNLALKWVKNNILNFGGDPDQITLFGHSAGSASVSYHLQSPLSKGLFNRAILQSGTSYCLWAYSRIAPGIARDVAVSLDIDTSSSESIVAGLRKINATFLQKKAKDAINAKYLTVNPRDGFMYAPVIEPEHDGAFMSRRSYELIKSGTYNKVPVMMGYTSLEGSLSISNIFRAFLIKFDLIPSYFVPIDMNIKNSVIKNTVGREIKSQYFGSIPVALSNDRLSVYISDDQFVRPIQKFAKMLAEHNPTYLYQFRYEGGLGGVVNRTAHGVAHGEEVGYLFRNNITANVTDALTRSRMIKLWTNFAKYENPTPQSDILLQNQLWLLIDPNATDLNYLNIDYDLASSINPDKSTTEFWSRLYDKYGEPPYDTY